MAGTPLEAVHSPTRAPRGSAQPDSSPDPLTLTWQVPALSQWCTVSADGDFVFACGAFTHGHLISHAGLAQGTQRNLSAKASPTAPAAQRLLLSEAHVTCVIASPDGLILMAGCSDGSACLWSGTPLQLALRLTGHRDGVSCVALQGDLPA